MSIGNQPAFPQNDEPGHRSEGCEGLSRRDYFAIRIMQSLMSACDETGEWMATGNETEGEAAKIAVRAADALITRLTEVTSGSGN